MARYLILIFASLLLILGCTQEETAGDKTSTNTEPLVTFLAAANEPTRGKAMSGDLDVTSNFKVYATKQRREGENIYPEAPEEVWVNGDVVSYQSIELNPQYHVWVWKTATDYYWPQDMYFVNFYAVHPASAPVISDILSSKVVNYDGTTHYITGDDDLMLAKIEKTRRYDSNYTSVTDLLGDNCTVNLTFHHLLSQIMFYGRLSNLFDSYGWTVEVGGITIHNVNSAATAQFTTTGFSITPASTSVPRDYTLAMNVNRQPITTTNVAKDNDGKDIPLTSPTDVTMLVPQTLAAWVPASVSGGTTIGSNPSSKSYLEIAIRIKDRNNLYVMGTANSYHTIYAPFSTSWQTAKRHNYYLTFGGGYDAEGNSVLQTLSIEAAITPWESEEVNDIVKRN